MEKFEIKEDKVALTEDTIRETKAALNILKINTDDNKKIDQSFFESEDNKIANMTSVKAYLSETKNKPWQEIRVDNFRATIQAVQIALHKITKKDNKMPYYDGNITGEWNEITTSISRFQKDNDILKSVKLNGEGDGVPGPHTITKILELLNQEKKVEPAIEEKPIEYPEIALDKLGEYTGYATVNYKNGTYKGQIEKGKIKGRGTYDFKNGGEYTGEQNNNKIEGRGSYDFKNGGKYTGEREDGKRNGYGTYELNNLSKYEGNRKDGNINGYGVYTNKKGVEFAGTWENNKLDDKTIEDLDKTMISDDIYKKVVTGEMDMPEEDRNNIKNIPKAELIAKASKPELTWEIGSVDQEDLRNWLRGGYNAGNKKIKVSDLGPKFVQGNYTDLEDFLQKESPSAK